MIEPGSINGRSGISDQRMRHGTHAFFAAKERRRMIGRTADKANRT